MILTDSVELYSAAGALLATVPAHVGYRATNKLSTATGIVSTLDELKVILEPTPHAELTGNYVRWRGKSYAIMGAVQIRRRGGRDHSFTLTLGDL